MSEKKYDFLDDELLENLKALKQKYSDFGVKEETIKDVEKNIIRSDPNYNPFEADFADGFPDDFDIDDDSEPVDIQIKKPDIAVKPEPTEFQDVYSTEKTSEKKADIVKNVPEKQPVETENIYFSKPVKPEQKIEQPPVQRKPVPAENQQPPVQRRPVPAENQQPPVQRRPVPNGNQQPPVQRRRPESSAPNAEHKNTPSKKNKKQSHKLRNALIVILVIATLWVVVFTVDFLRVYREKEPVFSIKTVEYEDGSKDYICALYKFSYHTNEDGTVTSSVMPIFVKSDNQAEKSSSGDSEPVASVITEPEIDNTVKVEVTIPKEFIAFDSENTDVTVLSQQQKDAGYISAKTNDAGDVIYTLGQADYLKLCKQYKEDTKKKLDALSNGTDYPAVKKVEYKDDFSSVTLFVDKAVYESQRGNIFVSEEVSTTVGFYRSFTKEQNVEFEYTVKNIADNTVISQDK